MKLHAVKSSIPSIPSSFALRVVLWTFLAHVLGCTVQLATVRPPPPQAISVTYRMPVIAPSQGAQQAITKGSITITATPVTYTETAGTNRDEVEVGRGITCRGLGRGIEVTPIRTLRVTTSPAFGVSPDRLAFLVKVSNQMPRVFRGAGTVVQLNVAGQLVSVPLEQYADLSSLLLPSRNEADVRIDGPPLASLPEGATIGLFLHDVVTRTDGAGNVTEKQNFEWYYAYRTDPVTRQGLVTTESREEAVGPSRTSSACR